MPKYILRKTQASCHILHQIKPSNQHIKQLTINILNQIINVANITFLTYCICNGFVKNHTIS